MFFLLSKLLLWLLQPVTLILLALALAYGSLRRGNLQAAKRLVQACLALMVVVGVLPLGTIMMLVLEERFPRAGSAADAPVTGIIVLGGAEESHISHARGLVSINDAGERMTEAMSLARRFPQARIVFTGGSTDILVTRSIGADTAQMFFREQGLDMLRLTLERQARNTYENAVLTKALIAPKPGERWLLVTSAFHMPRSMGCFRKVDWHVVPWPVNSRTEGWAGLIQPIANPADGFRRFEIAAKEWVGLIVYRLTGRSSALLPGPE